MCHSAKPRLRPLCMTECRERDQIYSRSHPCWSLPSLGRAPLALTDCTISSTAASIQAIHLRRRDAPRSSTAMTDAAPSPATAQATASPMSPATTQGQQQQQANFAQQQMFRPPMPGQQPSGPIILDDDKKRELIASMDQSKVMQLRKVGFGCLSSHPC